MKKLDKINRRILYELSLNSRISDVRLAKIVRRSKDTVRYRKNELEKAGIISGYTLWMDLTRIGYSNYKIYLKLNCSEKKVEDLKKYIRTEKRTFSMFTADGHWDMGIAFFAKNHHDFYDIQSKLFEKFHHIIISKKTCNMFDADLPAPQFLLGKKFEGKPKVFPFFRETAPYHLDEVDKKVLKVLHKESNAPMTEIARKTNTTIDVVRNRMKKLEKRGVIIAYVTSIDYNAMGLEFYKSFLYFKSFSNKDHSRVIEYLIHIPIVRVVVKMIGPWDLEIETVAKNYHEYYDFVRALKLQFPDSIADIESAIMNFEEVYPCEKMIFE